MVWNSFCSYYDNPVSGRFQGFQTQKYLVINQVSKEWQDPVETEGTSKTGRQCSDDCCSCSVLQQAQGRYLLPGFPTPRMGPKLRNGILEVDRSHWRGYHGGKMGIVCKTDQGPLTMFVQLRRFEVFLGRNSDRNIDQKRSRKSQVSIGRLFWCRRLRVFSCWDGWRRRAAPKPCRTCRTAMPLTMSSPIGCIRANKAAILS